MFNKLILHGDKIGSTNYGILLTPHYPSCYYAGAYGRFISDGSYYPLDNATCFWHRTETDALNALIKIIERNEKE